MGGPLNLLRQLEAESTQAYKESLLLQGTAAALEQQLRRNDSAWQRQSGNAYLAPFTSQPPREDVPLPSRHLGHNSPQRSLSAPLFAEAPSGSMSPAPRIAQHRHQRQEAGTRNALFKLLDRNKDGIVTRTELASSLNCTSPMMDNRDSAGAREELFELLDANRDGIITYDDFMASLDGPLAGQALFQALDRDGSGTISTGEFQSALGCRFFHQPGSSSQRQEVADRDRRSERPVAWFVDMQGKTQHLPPPRGHPTAYPARAASPDLFSHLDLNRDGVLSRAEFERMPAQTPSMLAVGRQAQSELQSCPQPLSQPRPQPQPQQFQPPPQLHPEEAPLQSPPPQPQHVCLEMPIHARPAPSTPCVQQTQPHRPREEEQAPPVPLCRQQQQPPGPSREATPHKPSSEEAGKARSQATVPAQAQRFTVRGEWQKERVGQHGACAQTCKQVLGFMHPDAARKFLASRTSRANSRQHELEVDHSGASTRPPQEQHMSSDDVFDWLDRNKDGVLSRAEFSELDVGMQESRQTEFPLSSRNGAVGRSEGLPKSSSSNSSSALMAKARASASDKPRGHALKMSAGHDEHASTSAPSWSPLLRQKQPEDKGRSHKTVTWEKQAAAPPQWVSNSKAEALQRTRRFLDSLSKNVGKASKNDLINPIKEEATVDTGKGELISRSARDQSLPPSDGKACASTSPFSDWWTHGRPFTSAPLSAVDKEVLIAEKQFQAAMQVAAAHGSAGPIPVMASAMPPWQPTVPHRSPYEDWPRQGWPISKHDEVSAIRSMIEDAKAQALHGDPAALGAVVESLERPMSTPCSCNCPCSIGHSPHAIQAGPAASHSVASSCCHGGMRPFAQQVPGESLAADSPLSPLRRQPVARPPDKAQRHHSPLPAAAPAARLPPLRQSGADYMLSESETDEAPEPQASPLRQEPTTPCSAPSRGRAAASLTQRLSTSAQLLQGQEYTASGPVNPTSQHPSRLSGGLPADAAYVGAPSIPQQCTQKPQQQPQQQQQQQQSYHRDTSRDEDSGSDYTETSGSRSYYSSDPDKSGVDAGSSRRQT